MKDPNYIYFNINSFFEGQTTFDFAENRVKEIMSNPSEYELSVERFQVPAIAIPIRFNKPNEFRISLQYNATRIDEYVVFPNSTLQPPLYSPYIGVWHYNELAQGISNTLKSLHDQMKIAEPTFAPTKPIYMDYEANTQLFPLYVQTSYLNTNIKLIFDANLYTLFSSFQSYDQPSLISLGNDEFVILLKDNGNNSTTVGGYNFKIQQQFSTIALMSVLRNIVFESNSIPIVPELLGQSSKNVTRLVITDFLTPRQGISDRSSIQYYVQGPRRWIPLSSSQELRKMDIKISWEDQDGNLYPIVSDFRNPMSVKLVFRKKDNNTLQELATNDDN